MFLLVSFSNGILIGPFWVNDPGQSTILQTRVGEGHWPTSSYHAFLVWLKCIFVKVSYWNQVFELWGKTYVR